MIESLLSHRSYLTGFHPPRWSPDVSMGSKYLQPVGLKETAQFAHMERNHSHDSDDGCMIQDGIIRAALLLLMRHLALCLLQAPTL